MKVRKVVDRFKYHVAAGENLADIWTEICKRDDFDRWLTGPEIILRNDMGCKSYNASRKLSVVEKVVNGKPRNGVEIFFENGDDFKARIVYLLVRSNNTNELNNTETQYILNTFKECRNFGIASVKTKHC